MKRFKHITTGKEITIGGKTGLSCQTLIGNSNLILGDIIKGEDWKEVIEKDYEILSLQRVNVPNIGSIVKFKNGITFEDKPYSIEIEFALENWVNKFKNHIIHSIKRLSDGEIFTIGDNISATDNLFIGYPSYNKISDRKSGSWVSAFYNTTIKEFVLIDDILCVIFTASSGKNGQPLNFIKKIKQPLFTTEDDVEIFEGDNFFRVWKARLETDSYKIKATKAYSHVEVNKAALHFSTKEKAEEYILMNKPCLSLNDILNAYSDSKLNTPFSKKFYKELKEITNTKING